MKGRPDRRIAALFADAHRRAQVDPPRPSPWTWDGAFRVGAEIVAAGVLVIALAALLAPLVQ